MNVHQLPRRNTREQVWLTIGTNRRWRITSHNQTYGEFDDEINARMFLALLLEGNRETLRGRT